MFFWFMRPRRPAQRVYLWTGTQRLAYSIGGGAQTGDIVTNQLAS